MSCKFNITLHLLCYKYYLREQIGRWSPERGVELSRVDEEDGGAAAGAGAGGAAGSYSLERWSAARRLRMIREAQRAAQPPAPTAHQAPLELVYIWILTTWFTGCG